MNKETKAEILTEVSVNKVTGKTGPPGGKKTSISMHENIPVWYDCCSCEAEPYWLEAMQDKIKTESK